jgi:hypothetical protein
MTGEIIYTYRQLKTFVMSLSESDLDKEVIVWDTTIEDDEVFVSITNAVINANDSARASELELCDHPCLTMSR